MTADSLLKPAARSGLHPVNISRHLPGLADLIELCFGAEMDPGGRAIIQEMRFLGGFGPALRVLEWLGLAQRPWDLGFVWIEDGRIVGSVSTQRARPGAAAWLVANVAVHPGYRRRGLALALMRATLDLIGEQGGREAILQVNDDNAGAVALYQHLGFSQIATHTAWRRPSRLPAPASAGLDVRLRRPAEWADQWALAQRVRPEGLLWNQPLQPHEFNPDLWTRLDRFFAARTEEHWVLGREGSAGLAASLTVQLNWPEGDRLSLLVHPDFAGQLERPMLARGLRRMGSRPWSTHLEHPAGDAPAEAALREFGFAPARTLRWMRREMR